MVKLVAGTRVRLVARTEVIGAVLEMLPGGPEDRCRVFHDGGVQVYYVSQLEALPDEDRPHISAVALHAGLTSVQLTHPSTRFLYSLNAGRIEFEPYQYRPVLKMIQSDRPRLLIADDVGVGKTIEAGLLIKELQARQSMESILVICPKPLVSESKWRNELKRFDEDFAHLDGETLRYCLDESRLEGQWPIRYRKAIVPYSLLDERLLLGSGVGRRRRPGLMDLDPPVKFDLLIVDEAHHIRNSDTWGYRNVQHLVGGAEAVVFLSATPIQNGNDDLFTLLNLLRPDLLPTQRDFQQMGEPNPHLSAASAAARAGGGAWQVEASRHLDNALDTAWGRGVLRTAPRTHVAQTLLSTEQGDHDTRVQAVRALDALNTFAGLINRTRRRDIGAFTTRKPETVEVDFADSQAAVYRELLDLTRRIVSRKNPGHPVGFLLSTLQRQAASCLNGLGPMVGDILARRMSVEEVSEADGDESVIDPDLLLEFDPEITLLVERAQALGDEDPKFDRLERIVSDKLRMPNNKLLIFSTFRHTLRYLQRRLAPGGARLEVLDGAVSEQTRRELRARFQLPAAHPDALDVLMSSEVGTEGLDYQFCDALVNYDLPWNPMRVEQRIGRIDRRGQLSETIAITNMITPGTVDAAIYHRCLLRIGVFQQALGGSEGILGDLTREMRTIAENLTLSDAERDERLRQLADNQLGRIHEQADLEDQQAQLFGLAVRHSDDAGVEDATSAWLTPAKLADLVSMYLTALDPARTITVRADAVTVLRPSKEVRAQLRADLAASSPRTSTAAVDSSWERWLKSQDPVRRLAVDPRLAESDAEVELLSPAHSLVRASARHAVLTGSPQVALHVTSPDCPPGLYAFAVYGWTRLGVRDDFSLQVVTAAERVQAHLQALLPDARDAATAAELSPTDEAAIEARHHALWTAARAEHQERNRTDISARLASLKVSHDARRAQLQEQVDSAQHERIHRMRDSQLHTADADYEARVHVLDAAAQRCDLLANPLIIGTIEVISA